MVDGTVFEAHGMTHMLTPRAVDLEAYLDEYEGSATD